MKTILEYVINQKIKSSSYINPIEQDCHIDLDAKRDWHNLNPIINWINKNCAYIINKIIPPKKLTAICDSENYYISCQISTRKTDKLTIIKHDKVISVGNSNQVIANPYDRSYKISAIIADKLGMKENKNEPGEWLAPGATSIVNKGIIQR